MTDNVTNDLLLEHLEIIQSKMVRTDDRLSNIESDIRIIKGHMAAFMQSEVRQDGDLASLRESLERIERRLELKD